MEDEEQAPHHLDRMESDEHQEAMFSPVAAIEVGEYEGEWTIMFRKLFPLARVLMIEAQKEQELVLGKVVENFAGVTHKTALLGAVNGTNVIFNINTTVSSALEEHRHNDFRKEQCVLTALDDLIAGTHFGGTDFIRLDVHCYELEELKGTATALQTAWFVLCEVSLIDINKGAPLLAEVVRFMDGTGFMTYDICSFIRRPAERSLWQTDLLFIKKAHPLTRNKFWI